LQVRRLPVAGGKLMTTLGPETLKMIEELASARQDQDRRLWRAFMLAPTIEVCEALLRGEEVPLGQLDQEWVRRFGLRRG
jgi:hypothetical protein